MKTKQFIALASLALMACACGSKDENTSTTQELELPKVKVTRVESRVVNQETEYTANVEGYAKNNIAPQANLRIVKILAEVGDRVSKGQMLVQLDDVTLNQMKLAFDNQQVEFSRVDELFKVGGVSKSEWDASKMNLEVKQTQYNNALENAMLRAPISGVVTARNYDVGDMTGQQPVLVLQQDQPVKLIVNVSEEKYPLLKKGNKVGVRLDTYGNEEFEGVISIVYPEVDANTHTLPIEIQMKNADRRVRPGMFARVTISYGSESHVVVPDQAVVKQVGAGDYYVYVLKNDGTVSYNKVELGRRFESEYEILSGVGDGVMVVVAGQNKLVDGTKVEVID
ncbi:MAG: efflux RND transporter periplasmic adaptor subunit [Bacteroidales bacterium]|nr:efflux RND transporter periplasmic adaptor subunit [Bacteroidales bacterium]